MDWSNYDNELFKKYSENLFDEFIDNRIHCGNLMNDNNILMKDYDIKPDEFILDKNSEVENIKNNNNNYKGEPNAKNDHIDFEKFYGTNMNSDNLDFSECKFSDAPSNTKFTSCKNVHEEISANQSKLYYNFLLINFIMFLNLFLFTQGYSTQEKTNSSDKNKYSSSSPFVNNQTSTNNYSNIDDSKSHSSESVSLSLKKLGEKNEAESPSQDGLDNMSMQNNNCSQYNHEGECILNTRMNLDYPYNSKMLPSSDNNYNHNYKENFMIKEFYNPYILNSQSQMLFSNTNKISISERMKLKIQKTKDLLEKKQYKACDNASIPNDYKSKPGKLSFNLEPTYEFSELKNINCCKKNDCPDCLYVLSRFKNASIAQSLNNNNFNSANNNTSLRNEVRSNFVKNKNMLSIDANNSQNNVFQNKLPKNEIEENKIKEKDLSITINNKNMPVANNTSSPNSHDNSICSNNSSKNSCLDMSLNENNNSFSGINNRNNLSKKELKMLRNRISAQKSRDRKKKEMDDLKLITQELFNQNVKLKKRLEEKETQINQIFSTLCKSCVVKLNTSSKSNICMLASGQKADNYLDVEDINRKYALDSAEDRNKIDDLRNNLMNTKRKRNIDFSTMMNHSNRNGISKNLKCTLMTGFLVIACIIGSFAFNYGFGSFSNSEEIVSSLNEGKGRNLQIKMQDDIQEIGNKSIIKNISSYLNFLYLLYFYY